MISQLQAEHLTWVEHNFPDQPGWQPLMGLVEEVGELAHAHLKGEQGIREGFERDAIFAKKIDAVGDLFIYLMSYCNAEGIDLESAIEETWDLVKQRDWQANPETGMPDTGERYSG